MIDGLDVAVVILNWNGREHLATYLPSVVAHSAGARIIVADNGSDDDSEQVVAGFPGCAWLALRQNFGFAEGYNRALAQVEADVFVLLNSDVRVTAGWLDAPVRRLAQDQSAGAVQPKLLADARTGEFEYAGAAGGYLDALGYPYCRGRLFDTVEEDRGQYDTAQRVDWATGACCFVRASAFRQLRGLDRDFFAHMEEIDFCWRLRRAGYSCWVEPSSVVYHLGGGTLAYQSPRKVFLNFRNSLATLVKNLPAWRVAPVVLARQVLDGLAGLRYLAAGRGDFCWQIVRAHFYFYVWLPELWMHRRLPAKLASRDVPGADGGFRQNPTALPESTPGPNVFSIVWRYYARGQRHYTEL